MNAAERWAQQMQDWAIPAEIVAAAPRRPYVFVPEMFAAPAPGSFELSLSNRRAAEALSAPGTVLDVGCGGGAAAFAVAEHATEVFGTDRQADMLELFEQAARSRGIAAQTFAGSWPEVAQMVPAADVVVCHNVLYNVIDIAAFVEALDAHARRRVVIEITPKHPQDRRREMWRHFWNLERPHEPTAATAVEAITELGYEPNSEESELSHHLMASRRHDLQTVYWCRQLCLPPEREAEVAEMMANAPFPSERVTIWWDTKPS